MLKNGLLTCGCVLALAGVASTALAEPPIAPPVLTCNPTTFDSGATTNRSVEHTFTVRNEGGAPLVIGRIAVCCGASCVITATNVPADASAEVRVRIALAGRRGPWRKAIFLYTNDPEHTIFALRLTGTSVGPGNADDFDGLAWQAELGADTSAGRNRSSKGLILP